MGGLGCQAGAQKGSGLSCLLEGQSPDSKPPLGQSRQLDEPALGWAGGEGSHWGLVSRFCRIKTAQRGRGWPRVHFGDTSPGMGPLQRYPEAWSYPWAELSRSGIPVGMVCAY